jgi:hypothetical protein
MLKRIPGNPNKDPADDEFITIPDFNMPSLPER